ncbi:MAG: glycosyltransferase [Pedobacter sp.]|nr:MAG: glycosyltransferase [Pedobacter sp.]
MSLISVIVPCFNQANYLEASLLSVEQQKYIDWECIIINDGSTDHTEEIAEKFVKKDKRFRYIYQQNGGLSNARNRGISQAKGEFIQLLDSDDLLTPDKIKLSVDHYNLKTTENEVIYYSSMRYFEDDNPKELKIVGRNNFIAHIELKEEDGLINQQEVIMFRNPFVISASLYPIKLFKIIGNFDEGLKALEDWDFHIRCSKAGFKFHHFYEKNALTLIRLHNASMMRNQKLLDTYFHQITIKHQLNNAKVETKPETKSFIRKLSNLKRLKF